MKQVKENKSREYREDRINSRKRGIEKGITQEEVVKFITVNVQELEERERRKALTEYLQTHL